MDEMKVKDHPHLVRRNGVIVNKDREGFERYVATREAQETKDQQIKSLGERVDQLTDLVNRLLEERK
jgi:hypothetical protein